MDNIMNIAKQGYEAYKSTDVSKTGGQELNSPPVPGSPDIDRDEAVKTAQSHGSGDSSLFATALSFLSDNKKDHDAPIDEKDATTAHKAAYEQNSASSLDARSLGSAAALQVLKQFTSGSKDSSTGSSGGGSSQTKLISLAMAEASKLFDKSGGTTSGNKQDAVNGAAMTVMKLFVQSKMGGGSSTTGGSDSGGLGQLFKMAQSFAK